MPRSYLVRLEHILEAVKNIRVITDGKTLSDLENDRINGLALERSFEIISEASRHLPEDLKSRHPETPWQKVAGIGNVLRHDYNEIAIRFLWMTTQEQLPVLERVCQGELERSGLF